jgi:sugar lactone lactonase YvrE
MNVSPKTAKAACLAFACLFFSSFGGAAHAQQYSWANFAGKPGGPGNVDGTGSVAAFNGPDATAVDGSGNVYVADSSNHTIRKITSAGVVTTLAGTPGVSGTADGTGTSAQFNTPWGVAVDGSGNIYVGDSGNSTIRKVTPAGVVTTFAGSAGNYIEADGSGTSAALNGPSGLAFDTSGNLFVADQYGDTIRKITPAGMVTTLSGSWRQTGTSDGTGSAARFDSPTGLAVDSAGNVYVADHYNHTIRKVTQAGVVTTLAGLGGTSGSADGTGSAARFMSPMGVAVDSAGKVYVADAAGETIRVVTPGGVVTTLSGSAGLKGSIDGTGAAARFNGPDGLSLSSSGTLYVSDNANNTIRAVSTGGVATTFAGSVANTGTIDGTGSAARFNGCNGVAVDSGSNVYIADSLNHTIRKVSPAGVVTTLAGSAGVSGTANGTGNTARFNGCNGVAVDSAGTVYVADTINCTIRKVTATGVVTTLAGSPSLSGTADGSGTVARFYYPNGLAVDSGGNLYVSDAGNGTIRKVTSAGVVTTLAGNPLLAGFSDGTGSAAYFSYPAAVAVDSGSNVYVADENNNRIRKVTQGGVVTTLAGSSDGSVDGTGTAAMFFSPHGVAVDAAGNIYVADEVNRTVRKVTSAGVVTTIGGSPGVIGGCDGVGSAANFRVPWGIAVDTSGKLYLTEDSRVSKGTYISAPPSISTTSPLPSGTVGLGYTLPLAASGGAPPYAWSISSGPLPAALNPASGVISGTPSAAGATSFTVRVTGSDSLSSTQLFSLTISAGPPAITTASVLPSGTAGQAYSQTLAASGGATPYAWSIISGALPAGLGLDSASGLISGTAAAATNASFTVQVTGNNGLSSTKAFSFTIISAYQAWQDSHFTSDDKKDPTIIGDTATPAGDGIPNLMKYALNLDPKTPSAAGLPLAGTALLSGNTYLTLTYTQVKSDTDITYIVEVTGDLQTWNSGAGYTAPVSATDNGSTETVTVRDAVPLDGGNKQFIRLKVTHP